MQALVNVQLGLDEGVSAVPPDTGRWVYPCLVCRHSGSAVASIGGLECLLFFSNFLVVVGVLVDVLLLFCFCVVKNDMHDVPI